MFRIQLHEDILPVSEFRYNVSEFIKRTKMTKRPILITQNGKGAAVLIDVQQFEELLEKSELAESIQNSEKQIQEGKVYSQSEAKKKLLNKIK